jgi:uncharacterized protein YecA (UPF0149 family)
MLHQNLHEIIFTQNFVMEDILKNITDSTKAYGYNISFGPITDKHITAEIQEEMERVHFTLNKKTKNLTKLIAEIKQLAWKYPDVLQFKNYLQIAYYQNKQTQLADELLEKMVEQHPEYTFGWLNKAARCIEKKDYDNFLPALKDANDVQDLAPNRNTFHVSEVLGFHKLYVLYACGIGDLDLAESRFEIMEKIGEDALDTQIAFEAILSLREETMEARIERSLELEEQYEEFDTRYLSLEQTLESPIFNHSQITYLYNTDVKIDEDKFDEILVLPRETLIQDLVEVLKDSIRRFKYYESINHNGWFTFHSLVLLKELKAKEVLIDILEVFRQGEDYYELYFGDMLTMEIWEVFYRLYDRELFLDFLRKPNTYSFAKSPLLMAVEELFHNKELQRDEAVSFYKDLLDFHIGNITNNNYLDIKTISCVVYDVCNLRLNEFVPTIKQLFTHCLVDEFMTGGLNEILEEIYTPVKRDFIEKFHDDYRSWYSDLKSFVKDDYDDEDFDSNDFVPFNEMPKTVTPKLIPNVPNQVSSSLSVGRNEPCLCGSGKKYKKCCMK